MIKPTFPDAQGRPQAGGERSDIFHISDRMSMTPKIIKARREAFYEALLNKTKDCHEVNCVESPRRGVKKLYFDNKKC